MNMRNRKICRCLLCLIAMLMLLTACSGTRAQEVNTKEEARSIVEALATAYLEEDGYAIVDLVHPKVVQGSNLSKEDIEDDLLLNGLAKCVSGYTILTEEDIPQEMLTEFNAEMSDSIGIDITYTEIKIFQLQLDISKDAKIDQNHLDVQALVGKVAGKWYLISAGM